jgi:prefoldin subunit 5
MSNDLIVFLLIAALVALGSGYYLLSSMTDTCDRIMKKFAELKKFLRRK